MEFLIVSGLSGGGKSRAADVLEDLDFYCVDNMPTALLTKFAELCLATRGRYEKVALVTDIRSQESFSELFAALGELGSMGVHYRILFVEASESAIVRRYKESRRPHPLQAESGCSLPEAIEDFLTKIGAPCAAMDIMSAKVEKSMNNSLNRKVNCDTANADTVVAAAQEQIDAIRRIERDYGLDVLPEKLQSAALLRIANPEASLADLATLSYPPVTKSCLNYRLKKLMEFHMDD